MFKNLTV